MSTDTRSQYCTGMILGSYRLVERLGGGTFAEVWKVEDVATRAAVALKILRDQYATEPTFLRRFINEARTAQSLPNNPHIIQIYDVGQAGNCHYIAMELLDGADLSTVMARRGALPIDEAMSYAEQTANGLACAHREHIIHRDIKPNNIRVLSDGRIKIMDFGLARAVEGTRLTSEGIIIGAPHYIAPEIWKGHKPREHCDVYALGIMIYEMLAGHPPYPFGEPYATTMARHLMEAPRPLTELRTDLPEDVWWIVARSLAKDTAQRYRNAIEVEQAIQGRSRGVVQRPASSVFRSILDRRYRPLVTGEWTSGLHLRTDLRVVRARASELLNGMSVTLARNLPLTYAETRLELVARGGQSRWSYVLGRGPVWVGRMSQCQVRLADPAVMPVHAEIRWYNGSYVIRPIQGHNQTWINGRPMPPHGFAVPLNVPIRMGHTYFVLRRRSVTSRTGAATPPDLRMLMALPHALIAAVPALGPLLVWSFYKDRSPFVAFQSKQAVILQSLVVFLYLMQASMLLSRRFPLGLVALLAVIFSIYAAWRSYQGVNFCYPIVGDLLVQYDRGR